jgi:hypothetical protein
MSLSDAKMKESESKLSLFLKTGSDWGKLKTSVPGIFILKMPAYKNSPARLAVELNPVDGSGSPTKKRGIVLRSREELEEYRAIFLVEKLAPLLEEMEKVNPEVRKQQAVKKGDEVLEI